MKARIYRITHGKIDPQTDLYTVELAAPTTVNNVLDVISQAKKRFNLWGKLFILVDEEGKMYMITKVEKKWYSYELKGPENELPVEQAE